IGIEVAADEAIFLDAALELADAAFRIDAGRLRQLAHADEVLRIEPAHPVHQLVRDLRPLEADAFVADVVRHAGRARREDRQVGAALALQLELRALDARADLVVADLEARARRLLPRVLDAGDLRFAEIVQLLRLGRVVAVTVDDHGASRDGRELVQTLSKRSCVAPRGRKCPKNPRCTRGNRQYGVPHITTASQGISTWPIGRVSTRSSRRSKAASRPSPPSRRPTSSRRWRSASRSSTAWCSRWSTISGIRGSCAMPCSTCSTAGRSRPAARSR